MANHVTRGFAIVAALGAIASCASFTSAANDVPGADAGDATISADGGSDGPRGDPVEGGAVVDSGGPFDCVGATFCETFDMGDMPTIAGRWGLLETSASCAGCVATIGHEPAPVGGFLHVTTTKLETYARLTHPLGPTTASTNVRLELDVRFTTLGSYEIGVFNFYDDNGALKADLAVRATMMGTLLIRWSDTSPSSAMSGETKVVADGAWHTTVLETTSDGANLVVDGVGTPLVAAGSPLKTAWPNVKFSAGAYFSAGNAPVVDIDNVRLDVTP